MVHQKQVQFDLYKVLNHQFIFLVLMTISFLLKQIFILLFLQLLFRALFYPKIMQNQLGSSKQIMKKINQSEITMSLESNRQGSHIFARIINDISTYDQVIDKQFINKAPLIKFIFDTPKQMFDAILQNQNSIEIMDNGTISLQIMFEIMGEMKKNSIYIQTIKQVDKYQILRQMIGKYQNEIIILKKSQNSCDKNITQGNQRLLKLEKENTDFNQGLLKLERLEKENIKMSQKLLKLQNDTQEALKQEVNAIKKQSAMKIIRIKPVDLVGQIKLHQAQQNFVPDIEAPQNTFGLLLQIYHYHSSSNSNSHGYMDATIRQKNDNESYITFHSTKFNWYANSVSQLEIVPWSSCKPPALEIMINNTYNTESPGNPYGKNYYQIRLVGFLKQGA